MTVSDRPQSAAFTVLLSQLNEIASQLAQKYQEDVEAALNVNTITKKDQVSEKIAYLEVPRRYSTFGDKSAGDFADCQNGGTASLQRGSCLSERSDSSDATANSSIPMEGTFQEERTPEKLQEIPDSLTRIDKSNQNSVGCEQEAEQSVGIHRLSDVNLLSGDWESYQDALPPQTSMRKKKSSMGIFQMRSPWIDQRDFDNVTLQEVMPEDMFAACVHGVIHLDIDIFEREGVVQTGKLSFLVFHPQSRTRGCWVLACMLLLLYDLVMIPIDVCFNLEETAFTNVMDVISAAFWTADIVFTFFVGVEQVQTMQMNPYHIGIVYLKSWLIYDVLLIVPEWLSVAITDDTFSVEQVAVFRMARWWRFMRLLRMARILRSGRLKPVLRRLVYVMNLAKGYLQLMQALAGLSFSLIAFIHVISCLWYAVGNSSEDGWVSVNGLKSATVGQAYVASVHWTFSRLHGMQAYSEMESATDLALDAVLIYVSLIVAGYYSGTLAAVAMTSANSQTLNLWKLSILFSRRHKISPHLDHKMTKFLECSIGGAMETAAEELTLLESLPKTLQNDLLFEARVPFLSGKPFLKDLLAANSRVIHRICTEAVSQRVCVDGESVFENGDPCHGMLFVMSGILFYFKGNSMAPGDSLQPLTLYNALKMGPVRQISGSDTIQLGAHSFASEPVLWTLWTHIGSLRTIVEAMLLVLTPCGFSNVVAEHREASCYAFKYAKRFLWALNHEHELDDLKAYHEISLKDLDMDMFEGTVYDHFLFLSHYKVEAGTEATLMLDLFQKILRDHPSHSANNLRSPIFVDSEDLTDLSNLKEHVKGSVAFVLLLTPGMLSRPWCLVEIVTAVRHGVNIVPVEVQRPGSQYKYPDDQFYANILNGNLLNQTAQDLLEGEGISLLDVERAIRKVFEKIAVPFSPHKTKGVREAELKQILSRSSIGQDHSAASLSSSPSSPW